MHDVAIREIGGSMGLRDMGAGFRHDAPAKSDTTRTSSRRPRQSWRALP